MMSRDFLARIEGLKIQIKPDIMKEVKQQLALWPEDRKRAYALDVVQLFKEKLGSSPSQLTARMDVRENLNLQSKLADVMSFFALAMLRVYQIKDLEAAQSEDDQAQA